MSGDPANPELVRLVQVRPRIGVDCVKAKDACVFEIYLC